MLLSRKWKCSLSNSFSEMPETFTLTLTSPEIRSLISKLTMFSHSSWIIHLSNFVHYSVTMTMDTELTQENFLLSSQNKFSSTTTTHLTERWTGSRRVCWGDAGNTGVYKFFKYSCLILLVVSGNKLWAQRCDLWPGASKHKYSHCVLRPVLGVTHYK